MKTEFMQIFRVLCLLSLAIVLQGCATYLASEVDTTGGDFYTKPVLTDVILAIGKPDEKLLKQMDISNTIAFIGKQNTYMLYLGGEELEQISKLKLDFKRMTITSDHNLFLKDNQVWGEIALHYSGKKKEEVSEAELAELKLGGFVHDQSNQKNRNENTDFQTSIKIEGVVYPAIKIPEKQISKLSVERRLSFYNPREASPPILGEVLKVPLVATGVVADVMLAPVYLGLGAVVLVGAVVSR